MHNITTIPSSEAFQKFTKTIFTTKSDFKVKYIDQTAADFS